jgi:hypothetical protein
LVVDCVRDLVVGLGLAVEIDVPLDVHVFGRAATTQQSAQFLAAGLPPI